MEHYRTRARVIPGTDYREVYHRARREYLRLKSRTKRRPYVRSAYFRKDKVFVELFWQHLHVKNWHDRIRRLKFYPAALELIRYSRVEPTSKENPNRPSEILHRFMGKTANGQLFYVQVKENKNTDRKDLISVFPEQKL